MAAAKKRRRHTIADRDRISNLPEPIIHQILSLLPPIDVIKTCLLSKTFQSALKTFPVIDLDRSWFNVDPQWSDESGEFVKYVNNSIRSIKLDKGPLQKFRLRAEIRNLNQAEDIRKAVKFAIRNRVKDLHIDFVCALYSIPIQIIRSATSVVTLNLAGLALSNLNGFDMSCCPLLENLFISNCSRLKVFKFSSSRIRSIALRYCCGLVYVKIRSNSLHNFKFSSRYKCDIDILECQFLKTLSLEGSCVVSNWVDNNVPQLVHLEDLKLDGIPYLAASVVSTENLKKLVCLRIAGHVTIQASNLQSLEVSGLENGTITFHPRIPQLNHLSCHRSDGITKDYLREQLSYMDGFDGLELEFDLNYKLIRFEIKFQKVGSSHSFGDVDKMVKLKIHLPINHDTFKIHLPIGPGLFNLSKSYLLDISSIIRRRKKAQLLDVTLLIDTKCPLDNSCFLTIWNWIASFGRVQVLELVCSSLKDWLYPENIRLYLQTPINDLKYVTVKLLTWRDISPKLVDSFLWQSPNLKTLRFVSTTGDDRSIEFKYASRTGAEDDLICCKASRTGAEDDLICCKFRKCWKHSMKKVVLKNFDDVESDKLMKWFSESTILVNTIASKRE